MNEELKEILFHSLEEADLFFENFLKDNQGILKYRDFPNFRHYSKDSKGNTNYGAYIGHRYDKVPAGVYFGIYINEKYDTYAFLRFGCDSVEFEKLKPFVERYADHIKTELGSDVLYYGPHDLNLFEYEGIDDGFVIHSLGASSEDDLKNGLMKLFPVYDNIRKWGKGEECVWSENPKNDEDVTKSSDQISKGAIRYFIAKITEAPKIFAESVIHNHWRMQQRYDHEDYANAVTTNLNNAKQVQKGDILILDNGGGLYAYGVVKESPKNVIAKASLQGIIKKHAHIYPNKDGVISFDDCSAYYEQNYEGCYSEWSQFIDVERWMSFCPKNPVSNSGVQDAAGGLSVHSIFGVKSEWAKGKIKELDEHFERNKTETDKMRENNKRLLEQKKNIILQGAPGTGKTYATAALALSLADPNFSAFDDHALVMARYEELQKKGQIAFTTFHQSLDYEDFVEGIKPQRKGDSVIYDIEDGIFKKIKDLALTNYEDSRKSDKELKSETDTKILFEKFCSKLEEDLLKSDSIELMPHSILKIRDVFRKSDGSAKSISISRTADSPYQSLSLDMVQRDYQKFKNGEIRSYEDIKPKYESKSLYHGNAIYYYELFKKMKAFEEANGSVTSAQTEKVELKNYVLIIDEINRGNVSKIFGELISLLESDKRIGGDHPLSVTLPYSKESFSVPSNLYIIGTMNTTDRSVGSIDYAVRRRFAFVTLKADENAIENYYKGKDASLKNKAIELFGKVEAFLRNKDNRSNDMEFDDLMVGHSYFMAETLDELKLKWEYEVIPLLKEYQKDGLLKHSIDIDKDLNVEIQEAKV
jgi:5-methylcytosine-specific restriction protein B